MVRAKDLESKLPTFFPRSRSELQQIFESLRDDGLLPTGGRGPNAPHITVQHGASILIAICSPRTLAQSAEFVVEWGGMKPVGKKLSDFAGVKNFRQALEVLLSDAEDKVRLKEVRITLNWPRAIIVLDSGKQFTFGYEDSLAASDAGYFSYPSRFEAILAPSMLTQMALYISQPAEQNDE